MQVSGILLPLLNYHLTYWYANIRESTLGLDRSSVWMRTKNVMLFGLITLIEAQLLHFICHILVANKFTDGLAGL